MELKKISYFIKRVELGSLSKAAEELYLTQPTLSRFLSKLEEECGAKLFEREKNNSLTLTECGKKYYQTALKINDIWQELAVDISCSKSGAGDKKNIDIGVSDDDMLPYVSECIDTITQKYPEVTCRMYCDSVAELEKKISEGTLDIAVSPYLSMSPDMVYTVFRRSEVDLVVSKGNPLAALSYNTAGQQDKRISLSDLGKDAVFTLIREHTVLRLEEELYFQKLGLVPNVQSTYNIHETVTEIVSHNDSLLGFCPRHLKSDKMAYIALEPPFYYKSAVYYRRDKMLTDAEKLMISLLKEFPQTRDI